MSDVRLDRLEALVGRIADALGITEPEVDDEPIPEGGLIEPEPVAVPLAAVETEPGPRVASFPRPPPAQRPRAEAVQPVRGVEEVQRIGDVVPIGMPMPQQTSGYKPSDDVLAAWFDQNEAMRAYTVPVENMTKVG